MQLLQGLLLLRLTVLIPLVCMEPTLPPWASHLALAPISRSFSAAMSAMSPQPGQRSVLGGLLPSTSLSLVYRAHELVRELRVVGGLARGVQRCLTAGTGAGLEALDCLLGKAQRLQQQQRILSARYNREGHQSAGRVCTSKVYSRTLARGTMQAHISCYP